MRRCWCRGTRSHVDRLWYFAFLIVQILCKFIVEVAVSKGSITKCYHHEKITSADDYCTLKVCNEACQDSIGKKVVANSDGADNGW